MKSKRVILAIFCTLLTTTLYAQKLSLGYLYPAGGEVGTYVEVEAGGLNINRATKVLFSHPGIKGEFTERDTYSGNGFLVAQVTEDGYKMLEKEEVESIIEKINS